MKVLPEFPAQYTYEAPGSMLPYFKLGDCHVHIFFLHHVYPVTDLYILAYDLLSCVRNWICQYKLMRISCSNQGDYYCLEFNLKSHGKDFTCLMVPQEFANFAKGFNRLRKSWAPIQIRWQQAGF